MSLYKIALIILLSCWVLSLVGCTEKKSPLGEEGLRESPFEVIGWADSPGGAPYGVCWDGTNRWITTRGNNAKIWALPPDSEFPITSFAAPHNAPSGIAYYNNLLWVTDSDSDYIFILSPYDGHIVSMVLSPSQNTSGIAWVNNKLYLADWIAGKLYRLDNNLKIEKTYIGAYNRRSFWGIGWDGNRLWVGDYTDGYAYCFDLDLNLIATDPYPFIAPGFHPTGWAWDGVNLLNTDTSANRIFKTNPPPLQ